MRNDGKIESQHYVPQFLLRPFSFIKKKKRRSESYIWAYDKHTDNIFSPNIKEIASENGFYDFYLGEEVRSMEPHLQFLEDKTKDAIKLIVQNQNLKHLKEPDLSWLSLFIAIQYLRVKKQREILRKLNDDMAEKIRKMGHDPDNVEGFKRLSDDEIKTVIVDSFSTTARTISNLIRSKIWVLFRFPESSPLYISDNPVVLHNDESFGPYGNIGFGVPGIQIYVPLSRNLALGFLCPTFAKKVEDNLKEIEVLENKAKSILVMNPNVDKKSINEALEVCAIEKQKPINFMKNVKDGNPIDSAEDCVTFLNSLQVSWSHRFVMASDRSFELVKRMIRDNDKYRSGNTITLG